MEKLLAADFLRSSTGKQLKRLKITVILDDINYNFLAAVLKKGYPDLADISSHLNKSRSFTHLFSPCCVFSRECSLALWTCLGSTSAFYSEASLWQWTDTFSVCVLLSFAVALPSQDILWAVLPSLPGFVQETKWIPAEANRLWDFYCCHWFLLFYFVLSMSCFQWWNRKHSGWQQRLAAGISVAEDGSSFAGRIQTRQVSVMESVVVQTTSRMHCDTSPSQHCVLVLIRSAVSWENLPLSDIAC